MIGIVLWSDPRAPKAVFWCEDHGDLAYYAPDPESAPEAGALVAGDMVQFDVAPRQAYREASNARLLRGRSCAALPRQLRHQAEAERDLARATEAAPVIALNLNDPPRRPGLRQGRG